MFESYQQIMKLKQLSLLVALTIGFVTFCSSQHKRYAIQNSIGVGGGLSIFDIDTDNFITDASNGFLGGLTANVDLPHKWYNISYGMQLSENKVKVSANDEFVEYKMFAAQVALLMHIKPIKDYFSIDIGPMLQYNGKLELEEEAQENYIINNYTSITANDITGISQFNINGAVGASLGVQNFKLKAQYIYGFTNTLKKLNDKNLEETDFKGNQNFLVFGASFYF